MGMVAKGFRAALLVLSGGVLACSGGASPTTPTTPPPDPVADPVEDFPADASAVHYHPIHHAALGPWYGSGCPDNGACGCGDAKDLAGEFTCQLDHLAANDIPITAYLFDGSAWSQGHSTPDNTCEGPGCCSWKLGDEPIQRLASEGVRGLLHFWGGCHDAEQYGRASARLGRNLLGFYLDDGSSDAELEAVSEFMQSALPGDWECVAKAYQNQEPSTSNTGLSKWANAAYVGDLSTDFAGLKAAVTRILAKAPYIPAPFAELTGCAYEDSDIPGEDVYYRRLHFGALQPVMDVERSYTGHGTTQSKGSLTMLVYPSGTSTFRYRGDAQTPWITFTSALSGTQLTLTADPGLPQPSVLYRIGRWGAARTRSGSRGRS